MKFKKTVILLLMCITCILTSCNTNTNTKTHEKTTKKETVKQASNTKQLSKNDKYKVKNYYNYFTAEEEKYIYCIDLYGLYKISKSDNTVKTLAKFNVNDHDYGYFLCLHNDYIYFMTCKNVCRIKKDGTNYIKFKNINQQPTSLKCIDDKLYAYCSHLNCCYDIKDDPENLKTIKVYTPHPTINKKNFFIGNNDDLNQRLYSADADGSNQRAILKNIENYYIYSDKIFYFNFYNNNLYVCNINGENSRAIYEIKNCSSFGFLDFDNDWLYIYDPAPYGDGNNYKRINIESKEVQDLEKIGYSMNRKFDTFEINNGYIFTREGDHAKYIKCDDSGDWQDVIS